MESHEAIPKHRTPVCYYITVHGLGHATRSTELIRTLLISGRFSVSVVSHVKKDFFLDCLKDFQIGVQDSTTGEMIFSYYDRNLDTGAVQADVFVVDAKETLAKYYNTIHLNRESLLSSEAEWLRERGIKLVLVDAIPLACVAGTMAGATTVLVSNFSWDFCFKEMLAKLSDGCFIDPNTIIRYKAMVQQCEKDTSSCTFYMRLPGATPLPTDFPQQKALFGPLIARQPRNFDIRKVFGVPDTTKVLLLGFGGHSATWQLSDHFLPEGWLCWVLGKY